MTATRMARDEHITLNDQRLHYRDWGATDAPAIVLLHGLMMTARTWDTVAGELAGGLRVLALDQRGFGESAWAIDYLEQRFVDDLAAFLDELGIERCALVGMSIGGCTAIGYAARRPERVERLVALECFTEGDETGDEPYLQVMRAHLAHMRALPASFADLEEAAAAWRPLAPHATEGELRRWMGACLGQRDDGRWHWLYDPAFRLHGPPGRLTPPVAERLARLARVECPVLLPVGAESWMVQPTEAAVAVNPRARCVRIAHADHWVQLDNPEGFLNVVGAFLAGRGAS